MGFKSTMVDVVIVGGGPVGLYTAYRLAKNNINVVVFEEHRFIGQPVKCAGLVSQRVLSFLPQNKHSNIILNKIKGATIYTPSHHEIRFKAPNSRGYVIDRAGFDVAIGNMAQDVGAIIMTNAKVIGVDISHNRYLVRYVKNGVKTEIITNTVIGADGPGSFISRSIGLDCGRIDLLSTYQIEAEIYQTDIINRYEGDCVKIYVGRDIAPGFFAWEIPVDYDKRIWRIGAGMNTKITRYMNKDWCLKKAVYSNLPLAKAIANGKGKIINENGGLIPIGIAKETVKGNVAIVGDAAAHVKPTSGGGIYLGLRAAEILAETIISNQPLIEYHRAWMNTIGREITMGLRLRRIFTSLSDRDLDDIAKIITNNNLTGLIEKHGDIDYPWRVVFAIVKRSPGILKYAPKVLWAIATS